MGCKPQHNTRTMKANCVHHPRRQSKYCGCRAKLRNNLYWLLGYKTQTFAASAAQAQHSAGARLSSQPLQLVHSLPAAAHDAVEQCLLQAASVQSMQRDTAPDTRPHLAYRRSQADSNVLLTPGTTTGCRHKQASLQDSSKGDSGYSSLCACV